MDEPEKVDRARHVVERAINCGWIMVMPNSREVLEKTIRIALDTEVRAGGPFLDKATCHHCHDTGYEWGYDGRDGPCRHCDAKEPSVSDTNCPRCKGTGLQLPDCPPGLNQIQCRLCHGTGKMSVSGAQPDEE